MVIIYKIDFVIPWVDGTDLDWVSHKNKHFTAANMDGSAARYKNWDNLAYWFRGVEKFAPWVNKIFFITWGHLPHWLNQSHHKLKIIRHEEYLPPKYLPTFSSHTIELNLHRIYDLAAKFVYFNDDTFIIKPVEQEDFFMQELPRDSISEMPFMPDDQVISRIIYNDTAIINRHFKKNLKYIFNLKNLVSLPLKQIITILLMVPFKMYSRLDNPHLPNSYTKELFAEVWEREPHILDHTCRNKFRSSNDVNQWLMRYWFLAKGEFAPRRRNYGKYFEITDNNEALCSHILQQKTKIVCCNDTTKIVDFEQTKQELNEVLQKILPDKSSYEL